MALQKKFLPGSAHGKSCKLKLSTCLNKLNTHTQIQTDGSTRTHTHAHTPAEPGAARQRHAETQILKCVSISCFSHAHTYMTIPWLRSLTSTPTPCTECFRLSFLPIRIFSNLITKHTDTTCYENIYIPVSIY